MKIALISDIHANLVALEAVLADIQQQEVNEIICLGDVATIGPQPLEVVRKLQEMNCICIKGNHDAALLDPKAAPEYRIAPPLISSLYWCRQKLSDTESSFLDSFKNTHSITLPDGSDLLCFHGSPRSTTDVILPTTSPGDCEQLLGNTHMAYLAGGHTHIQMLRPFGEGLMINPGSVGCAFPRFYEAGEVPVLKPKAEYAIGSFENGDLRTDMRQISFDIPTLKQSVKASDIPLKDWWLSQYADS